MKAGWELKTLGDVVKLEYGKPLSKDDRTPDGDFAVYGANGIKNYSNKAYSKGPSIVIGRKGSAGELTYVTKNFWPLDVTYFTQHDPGLIDLKFLLLSLETAQLPSMAKGVKPGINRNDVYALPIPLPPLEEQKRIVSILDEAFEGLDRARENAEANLKSARELFEERRRTLVSNKTTGDPLTLKDVCINFEYGTSSKSSATGCTPVLRMGNLQDGEIDWTNLVYSNDAGEREKYMLHKGDVLFNRTNSQAHVGKTSIFDGKMPAIFAGYLIRVTPKKEKLTNEFLNHYLNSDIAREYGRSVMGKSVNQANISGSRLKTYPINLPELERQHEITLELDALKVTVQEMQAHYRSKLQDISDLRQSLLQKAFAGELT